MVTVGGVTMSEVLFGGKREVTNEEVIDKMNYFIEKAEKGMEIYKTDKQESLSIAKELRTELDNEYKNNSLNRISKYYDNHELFDAYYVPAVHESLVSVTGALSYKKLFSFLYDVNDYMNYYIPSKYKS